MNRSPQEKEEEGAVPSIAPDILQACVDSLPDGVLLMDRDFRILYANRAARTISRIQEEHLGTKTHWELFPEAVGTIVEELYRRVMETGVAETLPDYFYEPFHLWVSVHVLPTPNGIALYYRDTTGEHRLDAEKRETEERLHFALDAANGVGVWDWDIVNDRVYADARFAQIYGVDPSKAGIGASITEFTSSIHAEDATQVAGLIAESQRTGGEFAAEYRLVQEDGSVKWVAARGRTILGDDGKPLRFPGVAFDITQQKQTEAALIQSEKLAAVGRMASSIAHEINNPLESVINLIYLARAQAVLPEVQQYLDLADGELRRVSVIANQTLRFHKQATSPTRISGQALFSTVLSLYEGRLRNAHISVDTAFAAQEVACFEGDIRQVLNNLVGNSIDAMPTGGRLLLRSQPGTNWRNGETGLWLTVADTGSGMSAASRMRAFEPFFTTKGFSGTGLGLWISLEIMNRHHGRFVLRSSQAPDRHGTVARLFLPFQLHVESPV